MTVVGCYTNTSSYSIVVMLNRLEARLTGCLLVTHLPVKVELRRRPELSGVPLVVTIGGPGRPSVLDASREAVGVMAGQSVSQSLSRCAAAATLAADPIHLGQINDGLLASLWDVVPRVEPAYLGVFYLDLTGMADMYGGIGRLAEAVLSAGDEWLRPRLGIGAGKFPAYCAAARAEAGGWRRVPAEVSRWLAPLPVSWLPLERGATVRLENFGIRTLGGVAALPPASLSEFLGPEGTRAWQLANGVDPEPVIPAALPERLSEELEFPFPVDTTAGIEAGLRALAERVWRSGLLRGRGVGRAMLEGRLLSGDAWQFDRVLRQPSASAEALVKSLLAGLGAQDTLGSGRWPQGALLDLTLTVSELVAETGRQSALWTRPPQRTVPEIAGVDRLARLVPDSALPERRWAFASSLAPLSAPSPVRVKCIGETPRRVNTGRVDWRTVARVVDLWEVDTEWWTPEPVRRRYWRLALTDGGLLTVYRDLTTGHWFRQDY